jgi:ubiquitin-protein ligase
LSYSTAVSPKFARRTSEATCSTRLYRELRTMTTRLRSSSRQSSLRWARSIQKSTWRATSQISTTSSYADRIWYSL